MGDTLTVTADVSGPAGVSGTPAGAIEFERRRHPEHPSAGRRYGVPAAQPDKRGSHGDRRDVRAARGSDWAASRASVDVEVGQVTPVLTWTTRAERGSGRARAFRPQATATYGRSITYHATSDCTFEDGEVRFLRTGVCALSARTEASRDHAVATSSASIIVDAAPSKVAAGFTPSAPAYGDEIELSLSVTGRDAVLPEESRAGVLTVSLDDELVDALTVLPPVSRLRSPCRTAWPAPTRIVGDLRPRIRGELHRGHLDETLTVARAAQTITVPAAPTGVRRGETVGPGADIVLRPPCLVSSSTAPAPSTTAR